MNSKAMMLAVDRDHDQKVTMEEWLVFWLHVKESGVSEEEIEDDIRKLTMSGSWDYTPLNSEEV